LSTDEGLDPNRPPDHARERRDEFLRDRLPHDDRDRPPDDSKSADKPHADDPNTKMPDRPDDEADTLKGR
jgi:hypothetical protein